MISNFTAARRAIYSQRSASRSDTRAWRGADVGFPLPSCFPIGRMRCEPSAAGLGTSRWMCVLGAQRPLATVAHVASEWPPDGRPRRRDGSFCGAGMPRAYVGRGWCSGRDRTVAYTSYNARLRGCPRLPGARVCFWSLGMVVPGDFAAPSCPSLAVRVSRPFPSRTRSPSRRPEVSV